MAFRRRRDPLDGVSPELRRVLDAASAPGLGAELTGQHAATAAFLASSTSPERAVSWSLAKLIATPVAAVVAVTGMTGGVALAAATGNLPAAAQSLASKVGAPAPVGEKAEAQRSATATASLTKTNRGRCTAVTMGNKTTQGKALQAPPLAAAGKATCPAASAPGSQRSATATANLADKPAKPTKPVKPAKPAKPTKPAKPSEPAAPTKPATPTKPAPPAKPVKPATAADPAGAAKTAHPDAASAPSPANVGRDRSAGRPGSAPVRD